MASNRKKHSFVPFYMDDWAGGTALMTRLIKSVYFDVCFHCWDKVRPVTEDEMKLMLADLEGQGPMIVNLLVSAGKLTRNVEGEVFNERALEIARESYDLWQRKSLGGKKSAGKTNDSRGDETHAESPVIPHPIPSHPNEEGSDDPSSSAIRIDENFRGLDVPPTKTYNVDKIVAAWNAMAEPLGLATVRKLSDARRAATRARLDEYDEAEVLEAIRLIPERPFCLGENDREWKADFDWLVHPEKGAVAGILEGGSRYGAEVHRRRQAQRSAPRPTARAAAEPEPDHIWTQEQVDEANANFRRIGIETRFKLGEEGSCITATVKEVPDPEPVDTEAA